MTASFSYTDSIAESMCAMFDRFAKISGGQSGVTCPGFSKREGRVMDAVGEYAASMGLHGYEDAFGNRIYLWRGRNPDLPIALGGSHVDSVPNGGQYDGRAGVAVRLAAMRMLKDAGFVPERGIGLIVFRNEESPWFGDYAVGSKLATAQLPPAFLDSIRRDTGRTLAAHLEDIGCDTAVCRQMLADGVSALPLDAIHHFHEAHIEQGAVLARGGYDVGVVTGIRGNVRLTRDGKLVFHGKAGHSGAVPMMERADAVAMGSTLVSDLRREIIAMGKDGRDAVVAFPIAKTKDGASPTTIPDYFEVQVEVRSLEDELLRGMMTSIPAMAARIAEEQGGRLEIDRSKIVFNRSALMNADLIALMKGHSNALGIRHLSMPSGAGHDAAIMAWAGVETAMSFISHGLENDGASHDPSEILGMRHGDDPFAVQGCFAKAARLDAALLDSLCSVEACHGARGVRRFEDMLLERHGRRLANPAIRQRREAEITVPAVV